jgi:hypothetical protein
VSLLRLGFRESRARARCRCTSLDFHSMDLPPRIVAFDATDGKLASTDGVSERRDRDAQDILKKLRCGEYKKVVVQTTLTDEHSEMLARQSFAGC